MATSADQKAAPGAFELAGVDGSVLQIAASEAGVSVYQAQAGTTGRGASQLTADEADQLAAALTNAAKVSRGETSDADAVKASDAAKKHAAELGVDLAAVQGSGKDGSVTKADVAAHAETVAVSEPVNQQVL